MTHGLTYMYDKTFEIVSSASKCISLITKSVKKNLDILKYLDLAFNKKSKRVLLKRATDDFILISLKLM